MDKTYGKTFKPRDYLELRMNYAIHICGILEVDMLLKI